MAASHCGVALCDRQWRGGQGQKMSIGASFSAVVDSGSIKPYRASERLRGWYLVRVLGNRTIRVFIYGDVCN